MSNIHFCRHRVTGALFPWTPQTQRIAREQNTVEPLVGTLKQILAIKESGKKQEVIHDITAVQVKQVQALRKKKDAQQYAMENFSMPMDPANMTLGEMKKELLIALGEASEEEE